jgi:hypothetical protein
MPEIKLYTFEPGDRDVQKIINEIISFSPKDETRSWFIYGYGKHPIKSYHQLREQGFDLIWAGFKDVPFLVKIFSFLIASYSGLIKIKDITRIESVIKPLSHLSMVGLFFVNNNLENNFVARICNSKGEYPDDYLKENDPGFFGFIVDGDNIDTESGKLVILQYGSEYQGSLKDIVTNFGKIGYLGNNG